MIQNFRIGPCEVTFIQLKIRSVDVGHVSFKKSNFINTNCLLYYILPCLFAHAFLAIVSVQIYCGVPCSVLKKTFGFQIEKVFYVILNDIVWPPAQKLNFFNVKLI